MFNFSKELYVTKYSKLKVFQPQHGFLSREDFPDSESPSFIIFFNLGKLRISQISILVLFSLTVIPSISLYSQILL